MKKLFDSYPIASFLILTFGLTYFLWFFPVWVSIPKDLAFACILIGVCSPLLIALLMVLAQSEQKFRPFSIPVFAGVSIAVGITLSLRIYFSGKGLSDINGFIPTFSEFTPLGFLLLLLICLLIGLNASQVGNKGIKENYITSFRLEKSKVIWYLVAIGMLPLCAMLSYLIGKSLGLETTDYFIVADPLWLIGFFSTFLFFGGNEEFGWRGLFQKEFQKKYSPLAFVFCIHFLWSFWHLPLNYNGFYSTGGLVDFLPRLLGNIPLAFFFTWLYNRSNYSILALVIFHAMTNNFNKAFGSSGTVLFIILSLLSVFCLVNDQMWKKKPSTLPS